MEMDKQLQKGLTPRHISMMAIGGTIGAGIFMGSADTLTLAGPGIVVAYLIASFLLFHVMGSLSQMAQIYPGEDIRGMIQHALGRRTSFIVGWLYLLMWLQVLAIQIVAAGTFLHYWFTSLPVWLLSFLAALAVIVMNQASVRIFGEMGFWLSAIKVIALLLFAGVGVWLIGVQTSSFPALVDRYTAHGGFFPHGWAGISAAFLVVIFSFGGSELIGLTLPEAKSDPQTLPRLLRGLIAQISFFYVFPLLVICGLIPWNEVGTGQSPFVTVLTAVGLEQGAHIMNFIMLTAVVSAANSGIYAASRTLYSLASDGEAPRLFTRLSKQSVPIYSLIASSFCLFIGVWVAFIAPEDVFRILMSIPGFSVLLMWATICLAYLKLGKNRQTTTKYRPFWVGLTVIALSIIFISTAINKANLISTLSYLVIVLILFFSSRFSKENSNHLPIENNK
jgi:amino acid transporter, AAT family